MGTGLAHRHSRNGSSGKQPKGYLEANNKKTLTIYRRLSELRFILKIIGKKDAKVLTREDVEGIVRQINTAKRKSPDGTFTDIDLANIGRQIRSIC